MVLSRAEELDNELDRLFREINGGEASGRNADEIRAWKRRWLDIYEEWASMVIDPHIENERIR